MVERTSLPQVYMLKISVYKLRELNPWSQNAATFVDMNDAHKFEPLEMASFVHVWNHERGNT
jgi:hypothetical protein